ncbi:MAG TPA: Dabb family protein [Steroidobacter sp.]|jgi:hypothetical protein|nr:Dabb family protein [Steroidobacteraceae bacterium]HLS81660.1 Dabb family protein [Steroidobacter sp.]
MFNVLKLIELAPGLAEAQRQAFRDQLQASTLELPGLHRALLEPAMAGSYNSGDLIWRATFLDRVSGERALGSAGWRRSGAALLDERRRVVRLEHVAFESAARGGVSPPGGLYRVALFCANHAPSAERLARYDAETRAMPRYIRTIRSWQLATTCEATGSRPWTHVWEQEYEDLAGLTGAYMMHPFHWAHIDRWYDPESPHWLVDPYVCHGFCATRAPVIDTAVDAVDGVAR